LQHRLTLSDLDRRCSEYTEARETLLSNMTAENILLCNQRALVSQGGEDDVTYNEVILPVA